MKTALALSLLLLPLSTFAQSGRVHSGPGITLQQLAEVTGSQAGDDFGLSVAVSGNTLVVGAPNAACESGYGNCGAAYVYTAVNGDWANPTQVATLNPPSDFGPFGFGSYVAIDGNTIVVGGSSATYVYVNPSGNATATAVLTTADGSGANSIAIDGGTIVVGVIGVSGPPYAAAFVYVEPSTGWADMTETAELVSKDVSPSFFGLSTAISGRNIVVGATEVSVGGLEQGAAYLFVEPTAGWSGTWAPTTELEASNGTRKAEFGNSVSVSGDTVAVGAPFEASGSADAEGAVYMFTRPAPGWPKTMTETAELTASNPKAGSELGLSVALSGKTLFAGAPFEDAGQGFVYVFSEPSGGWRDGTQAERIAASNGSPNDYFGYSVATGGGVIGVGAWGPYYVDPGDGAAYIFGSQ